MTVVDGSKYYAGSYLNSDIIQDDVNYDIDGDGIPFQYKTVNLNFGSPLQRKLFKGWAMSGEINYDAVVTVDTIVD
jgi:hypothetical protein